METDTATVRRWAGATAYGARVLFWALVVEAAVPLLWWSPPVRTAVSSLARSGGSQALKVALQVQDCLVVPAVLLGLFLVTIAPPGALYPIAHRHRTAARLFAIAWGAARLALLIATTLGLSLPLWSAPTLLRAAAVSLGFAYLSFPFRLLGRPRDARSSLALAAFLLLITAASVVREHLGVSWRSPTWWQALLFEARFLGLVWAGVLVARLRSAVRRPEVGADRGALDTSRTQDAPGTPSAEPSTAPVAEPMKSAADSPRSLATAIALLLVCAVILSALGGVWRAGPSLLVSLLPANTHVITPLYLAALIASKAWRGYPLNTGKTSAIAVLLLCLADGALVMLKLRNGLSFSWLVLVGGAFVTFRAARRTGWDAWRYACMSYAASAFVVMSSLVTGSSSRRWLFDVAPLVLRGVASFALLSLLGISWWSLSARPRRPRDGSPVEQPESAAGEPTAAGRAQADAHPRRALVLTLVPLVISILPTAPFALASLPLLVVTAPLSPLLFSFHLLWSGALLTPLCLAALITAKLWRGMPVDDGKWIAITGLLAMFAGGSFMLFISASALAQRGQATWLLLPALAIQGAIVSAIGGAVVMTFFSIRRKGWDAWLWMCAAYATGTSPVVLGWIGAGLGSWRFVVGVTYALALLSLLAISLWGLLSPRRSSAAGRPDEGRPESALPVADPNKEEEPSAGRVAMRLERRRARRRRERRSEAHRGVDPADPEE